jgi:hypothetical protein
MQATTQQLSATSLRIVYFAIVGGQIIMTAVFYFLHQSGAVPASLANNPTAVLIGCAAAAAAAAAGKAVYAARLRAADGSNPPAEPQRAYFTATIILLAALEASTMLLGACYLLTGHIIPLLLAPFVLVLDAMHFPSEQKMPRE